HVADLRTTFEEYLRVLEPGGKLLLLEITPPASRLSHSLLKLYLGRLVPLVARFGRGGRASRELTVRHGLADVVMIDDQPPLSVTSDKSTECYRNWWPGPGDTMVRFMNRSIDLLEELSAESGNRFV